MTNCDNHARIQIYQMPPEHSEMASCDQNKMPSQTVQETSDQTRSQDVQEVSNTSGCLVPDDKTKVASVYTGFFPFPQEINFVTLSFLSIY